MTKDYENSFDYLTDDGLGGNEQMTSDVIAFPFLRVLQSISPQCKKKDPAYVEGAEEGMLYNNIANVAVDTPVKIVVGKFERMFIEWKPNRGGFAGAHMPENIMRDLELGHLIRTKKNRIVDPNTGNEFSDTYTYYVVLPEHMDWGVCLLCLSSTQLKEARRWNRLLTSTLIPGTGRKARLYHMVWDLSTVAMSNDQGSWAGIHVELNDFVAPDVLQVVQEERKALAQSTAQVNYAALEANPSEDVVDVTTDDHGF